MNEFDRLKRDMLIEAQEIVDGYYTIGPVDADDICRTALGGHIGETVILQGDRYRIEEADLDGSSLSVRLQPVDSVVVMDVTWVPAE